MSEVARVLEDVMCRFGGKRRPDRKGRRNRRGVVQAPRESTIHVAALLERFIGQKFPIGEVVKVSVPDDCTWSHTVESDAVKLVFTNPPALTVAANILWFDVDFEVYLARLDVRVTHLELHLQRLLVNRKERVEIDWAGP